jgi:hypothetical protein
MSGPMPARPAPVGWLVGWLGATYQVIGVGFYDVVGVGDLYSAYSGEEYITLQKLGTWERWM